MSPTIAKRRCAMCNANQSANLSSQTSEHDRVQRQKPKQDRSFLEVFNFSRKICSKLGRSFTSLFKIKWIIVRYVQDVQYSKEMLNICINHIRIKEFIRNLCLYLFVSNVFVLFKTCAKISSVLHIIPQKRLCVKMR